MKPRTAPDRTLPLFCTLLLCASTLALGTGCVKLYENTRIGAVGAEYWFPELEGDISRTSGPLSGEKVEVDDDLDLEDEDFPVLRGMGQIGSLVLDVSYFSVDYSGDSNITRTFDFNGLMFTVGAPVSSDFELEYASAKAKLGLLRLGPAAAGVIVGVNYFDLDVELTSPGLGSASDRIESPFPVVGAIVTFDQRFGDHFSLFADGELSGFAIDDEFDLDGHFFDAAIRAGFQLTVIRIGGGFRWIDVDLEDTDSDFDADLTLSGPFVFAELTW